MKKLESTFIRINTNEVIEFLTKLLISFRTKDLSSPQLWFFDENWIEAGRYDFEIDGLVFRNCWIEPFEKSEDEPYRYCSGSYEVIKNS